MFFNKSDSKSEGKPSAMQSSGTQPPEAQLENPSADAASFFNDQASKLEGELATIGLDLGTTHSVIAYSIEPSEVSTLSSADMGLDTCLFNIPQLVGPGTVGSEPQLPSFIYQPHPEEVSAEDVGLPWSDSPPHLIGEWARALGAKTSIRLVHSAKSWLSQSDVDRKSEILPLESLDEVEKISPYEASKAYLAHMQAAWNSVYPKQKLEDQPLVLTVPASFDPAARALTAEAAAELGMQELTLLEEPQAAVYAWLSQQGKGWRDQLKIGDILLVVDVGGGTTDFSLIAVNEDQGTLALERIAVGDHILLGGDNMDLALAYALNARLQAEGKRLQSWQILGLTQACREAKEQMFANPDLASLPIVVPSRGSKLIGGTLRTELTREMLEQVLVEGFFPKISIDQHPQQQPRGALKKQGLAYAQDAGITRHLALFLAKHTQAAQAAQCATTTSASTGTEPLSFVKPAAILLNGGVFKATPLSERLLSVVNTWLANADSASARLLDGADLDLAVARGAAYYGQVRRGRGVRIRGGIAHAYYIGIEQAMPAIPGMPIPVQALCIAPFGMEEGAQVTLESQSFGLVIGQPVRFQFFSSTTRRQDGLGTCLEDWLDTELEALPDIQATLAVRDNFSEGDVVDVQLKATVTEVGTLKIEAVPLVEAGQTEVQPWQVELDVREIQ